MLLVFIACIDEGFNWYLSSGNGIIKCDAKLVTKLYLILTFILKEANELIIPC